MDVGSHSRDSSSPSGTNVSNPYDIRVVAAIPRVMARKRATATALVFGERATSYQELHERSNRCAQALLAEGVKPGDRVAVLAKDSDDLLELIFGIAKAGAVFLGINWRLAGPEVRFILEDSEAVLLFAGREFHVVAAGLLSELPRIRKAVALTGRVPGWPEFRTWRDAHSATEPALETKEEDVFALMYTSGTTGNPKGVQLANRSFFAVVRELHRAGDPWIGWNEKDVSLHSLPSFHIAGLWWAITTLTAGGSVAVMEQWVARDALRIIETEGVTKAFFVPAMVQMMLMEPSCATTDFSRFGPLVYGGAPMPPALLEQSIRTFRCPHVQIYGLTETGNTATCLRAEEHGSGNPERLRSAGRPYPGVRVSVLDTDGREVATGAIGEICIHSPANMIGYWKRDDATSSTLVDGWLHTGDAGYLDEDGFVYICDRVKEMIIYAGENVYPAEVENALCDHPAVAEAAVFGLPDERWGELIKAVVVLRPGAEATPSQILQHLRGRIADFKVPHSVSFADSLPRTSSGKVQKRKLREPYWEGTNRRI
jgi:acyl-CoA synthetase (AMP-forming)/AMP-acid ligase II